MVLMYPQKDPRKDEKQVLKNGEFQKEDIGRKILQENQIAGEFSRKGWSHRESRSFEQARFLERLRDINLEAR